MQVIMDDGKDVVEKRGRSGIMWLQIVCKIRCTPQIRPPQCLWSCFVVPWMGVLLDRGEARKHPYSYSSYYPVNCRYGRLRFPTERSLTVEMRDYYVKASGRIFRNAGGVASLSVDHETSLTTPS